MENEKPSLQRVDALVKAKRYDEALKEVWKVLVNQPENIEALFYSGGCYFRLGDYTNARKHWERLLTAQPDHDMAKAMLAKVDALQSAKSASKPIAEVLSESDSEPEETQETVVADEVPITSVQPEHKSGNLKYCPSCGKETSFSVVPPPAWLTTVLGQHGHKTWRMKWRCQTCGHIKEGGIG